MKRTNPGSFVATPDESNLIVIHIKKIRKKISLAHIWGHVRSDNDMDIENQLFKNHQNGPKIRKSDPI